MGDLEQAEPVADRSCASIPLTLSMVNTILVEAAARGAGGEGGQTAPRFPDADHMTGPVWHRETASAVKVKHKKKRMSGHDRLAPTSE